MQRKPVEKPRGFLRLVYRFPIRLYRIGLGGLFGKRFILLRHIGRKSGRKRQVLLEVIRREVTSDVVYVIAAYGEKADWVRNVRKNPLIRAQLGRYKYGAEAVFLDEEERIREYMDYARRHPKMAVSLPGMVGYELDGSEEDFIAFAKEIVMVAVKPA